MTFLIRAIKRSLVLGALIISMSGCDKEEIISVQLPDDFSRAYTRSGIIKSQMAEDGYYLLFEELSPLLKSPGLRYLIKSDFMGGTVMRLEGDPNLTLIDFVVSDDGVYTLYSGREGIEVRKHNRSGGHQVTRKIWINHNNDSYATDDRGRLVVYNKSVLVAIRPEDYSTRLYALNTDDLDIKWSTLVEPGQSITGYGMTGGSYDTFEQLAHPYIVFVDVDERGNAYVSVPALFGSSVYHHNRHFGENLAHVGESFVSAGFETDALVTKISPEGERLYTVVAGTADPDECYGIKVENGSFYLYGRTAKPASTSGYQWDAYVAKFNSDDGNATFRKSFDVNQSEIIYDLAETESGELLVVGSTGWSQNPLGYSVSGTACKLLVHLDAFGDVKREIELTPGQRHNQIRTIQYHDERIWLGGWENGPGTHTGDTNPNLVFADGFWLSQEFQE
ncbi:MAG: hypothetical protein HEP71_16990 [Roseivirga sp.]|nr:hypothetical protein [Roseivirga sp.]